MMKMYRREEKKERKKGKGSEELDSSDAVLAFDPREMRALRSVVLQTFPSSLILSSVSLRSETTSFCIFHDSLLRPSQLTPKVWVLQHLHPSSSLTVVVPLQGAGPADRTA